MFIETRYADDKTLYFLVDKPTEKYDALLDCSQDCFEEYGEGNNLFLFEASGRAYQPAIVNLIHANTIDEAEQMVQSRNRYRFLSKTLIRLFKDLQSVTDGRYTVS